MSATRTAESDRLTKLAELIAAELDPLTHPRAVMLIGSAAEGISDGYSDLDLAVYHDALPSDEVLATVRDRLGGKSYALLGPRTEHGVMESFTLQGVECQLAHTTVAAFQDQIDEVLVRHTPGTVTQKILEGLVHGRAIRGENLITGWKSRASYPPEFRQATVEHFLRIRPIWFVAARMEGRDAAIFLSQMRIDAVLNILGILAGLNSRYFSTFQFKRMCRFAEGLEIKPHNLAARLDEVFALDPTVSAGLIEGLAKETYDLVASHMPDVDLSVVPYPPGTRQQRWA